jgi:hypothetical protein
MVTLSDTGKVRHELPLIHVSESCSEYAAVFVGSFVGQELLPIFSQDHLCEVCIVHGMQHSTLNAHARSCRQQPSFLGCCLVLNNATLCTSDLQTDMRFFAPLLGMC